MLALQFSKHFTLWMQFKAPNRSHSDNSTFQVLASIVFSLKTKQNENKQHLIVTIVQSDASLLNN